MKILIVGSQGFIGSNLVRYFIGHKNFEIFGCDLFPSTPGDFTYIQLNPATNSLERLLTDVQFDICVNAAGSGNVSFSISNPVADFEANTLETIRLLDGIKRFCPGCKYIHISSAAVYGNPAYLPVPEEAACNPLSPYGWHKLMSEHICSEYHNMFGVQTTVVRPFSVYGEGMKKQLLWDICQKITKSGSVQLYGTGEESRDFIHVLDFARLIFCLIENAPFNGEIYNAASGIEISIKKIAALFEEHYGNNTTISFTNEVRPGDPNNWRADTTRIKMLGYSTSINFNQGVINYINWFESRKNL